MVKKEISNKDNIEKIIKIIHKENKDNVPKYLDKLKREKQIKINEASYNNGYLKYML